VEGEHFDVLVVGSGPAGSVTATVLARGGARVALVDKAAFPRDKACGDLVGPRGVGLLADLGFPLVGTPVDDMVVVGPTGRRVRLPCLEGVTYPGRAIAVPRAALDAGLRGAALEAGAVPFTGRVAEPLAGREAESLAGFVLDDGRTVRADVVVGADGATSRVAEVSGLVDPARVLWSFALRAYVEDPVTVPHLVLWEPRRWQGLPGYGWLFPGVGGRANVGLGLGVLTRRPEAARAAAEFAAFVADLRRLGVLTGVVTSAGPERRLGGWLKLGMIGTGPARGPVLLVGDAAGLVNPLQGEGIAPALESGRAAAEAILAGPARAAARYRAFVARRWGPYHSATAPVHAALLGRPWAVAGAGRVLTAPGVGRAVAGGWSIFWNDLLAGARPGPARTVAAVAQCAGRAITARGRARAWFDALEDVTLSEPSGRPAPTARRGGRASP
jgi:geranylgeranyl reductase family protein